MLIKKLLTMLMVLSAPAPAPAPVLDNKLVVLMYHGQLQLASCRITGECCLITR